MAKIDGLEIVMTKQMQKMIDKELKKRFEELKPELAKRYEELLNMRKMEADQFNDGFNDARAGKLETDQPHYDLDTDNWRLGYAWGMFEPMKEKLARERQVSDALNARIAELEEENERLSQLLHECKALEAENAELRDVIGDYRNDASRVLDEKCPSDERHCGCVPILRDQLNKYQKALILITTMPELSQATTIAREALQERGKFIWTEQSVGEYWVTKLDILQDKFDTLEKDYADVCQKRLEAAEVWSRQIIELESENAELKAERRWIPVSERLPEENQQILSTDGKEFYLDCYARWEGKDNPPCFYDRLFLWAVTHWMPLPQPPEDK